MVGSYWVCHWKKTFWVGGCDGIGGLAYLLFCAAYWSRQPRVFRHLSRSCCLLLGVSPDWARPIMGQVTSVTWPVIGWALFELTLTKRQKMGPGPFVLYHLAPHKLRCFIITPTTTMYVHNGCMNYLWIILLSASPIQIKEKLCASAMIRWHHCIGVGPRYLVIYPVVYTFKPLV